MHVIACIEDSAVIEKILAHLNEKVLPVQASLLPKSRAPPQAAQVDCPEGIQIFVRLLLPTGRGRVAVGTRAENECLSWEIGKRARQNRANIRSDQDEKHCKRLLNRGRLHTKGLLFFLYSKRAMRLSPYYPPGFLRNWILPTLMPNSTRRCSPTSRLINNLVSNELISKSNLFVFTVR